MTSDILLLLPILIPFATAITLLFAWKYVLLQRAINIVGSGGTFAAAILLLSYIERNGIQATQVGNWPAPFGITMVADLFSAIMVTMAGLMGLGVAIYSLGYIDTQREAFGYYPLFQILIMGVCGAFLTGDVFNLYVWFEIMLISSFVLLALGGERAQLAGAFKYVTINLLASAIFLTAASILYGVTGTLNMADAAQQLSQADRPTISTALSMLFLVAFGIKAALFPLFFWLPDSYHTPPIPVTTIFSALLTKVGVYALVRFFTLIFVYETEYTHSLLMVIAGLTMVTGVLGAVAQMEFRRLLSFHIISQIGYLIMGLAIYTPLALAGTVFFMVHVIITKSALFMVSGVVKKLRGTYELKPLGGLYTSQTGLAVLFFIAAMSLSGIPPLSGFWAKFVLVRAGIEAKEYTIVAVGLCVSVLTLFSMTKIWTEVFWKTPSETHDYYQLSRRDWFISLIPIGSLVVLVVGIGIFADVLFKLSMEAADQLFDSSDYMRAVLGESHESVSIEHCIGNCVGGTD